MTAMIARPPLEEAPPGTEKRLTPDLFFGPDDADEWINPVEDLSGWQH